MSRLDQETSEKTNRDVFMFFITVIIIVATQYDKIKSVIDPYIQPLLQNKP